MSNKQMKILLIEDNPGDVRLIKEMLNEIRDFSFELECFQQLSDGLTRLAKPGIDIVIIDLFLPDGEGLGTLQHVITQSQDLPIIVLTGLDDVTTARQAVRMGAQEYLVKERLNSELLKHSLHLAIERNNIQEELRTMSLKDELTGLYNRRGFIKIARQQWDIHYRMKRTFYLLFMDLDSMKWINDTFGHKEGDLALKKVADILKASFRKFDIIARMGGDEFGILIIDTGNGIEMAPSILERLQRNIEFYNNERGDSYRLSLSVGLARFYPVNPSSIEELLVQADALMYKHKRKNSNQSEANRRTLK